MTTDNNSFNQLVKYVDTDLADELSDEQRDNILALAGSAAFIGGRVRTRIETQEAMLAAARREPPMVSPPIEESWIGRFVNRIPTPILVGVPISIIVAAILLNL